MELSDDATYPMRGVYSISLWIPLDEFLEVNDVFFVPSLKKNLLSIS